MAIDKVSPEKTSPKKAKKSDEKKTKKPFYGRPAYRHAIFSNNMAITLENEVGESGETTMSVNDPNNTDEKAYYITF